MPCIHTHIQKHHYFPFLFFASFSFSFYLLLSFHHPPSISPVPGLGLVEDRQKSESSEKAREKGERGKIGFPFHIGSLEWSLKPQCVLALDKEARSNKYVD